MCDNVGSEGEVIMDIVLLLNTCDDIGPLIKLIKSILAIIQFVIPVLLILLGTIDLGKAVISSDDKEVKAAQSRLIKRVIYAVAVFFVALLVNLVMGLVADSTDSDKNNLGTGTEEKSTSWSSCWKKIK